MHRIGKQKHKIAAYLTGTCSSEIGLLFSKFPYFLMDMQYGLMKYAEVGDHFRILILLREFSAASYGEQT